MMKKVETIVSKRKKTVSDRYMQDDARIKAGVESDILATGISGVSGYGVTVHVEEGVVALRGKVPNLLIHRQAEEAAESLAGVRAVVNEIVVEPGRFADSRVRDNVQRKLERDSVTRRFDIHVDVADGRTVLEGHVDSRGVAGLCADVARSVAGVREIQNKLTVDDDIERSDDDIAAEIRESLNFDARLDSRELVVAVRQGHVEVSGVIHYPMEEKFIAEHAWTNGASSADLSSLEVIYPRSTELQNDVKPSDRQIIKALNDAMSQDARVHYFQVQVSCDQGHVTLEGEVEDFRAKKAALQDADNTRGVLDITDLIKVHPARNVTDDALIEECRREMVDLPFEGSVMPELSVKNGEILLSGNSKYRHVLKAAANRLAAIEGVVDIQISGV